jgi:DNA-binding transcriptional LysR family regulator
MNFHKLDLNLLVALDALLEERHVGRAAEHLHVSQPTMSVALAKLREHYKDELLIRDGRAMAITPFAASLKPILRQFISDTRSLVSIGPGIDLSKSERHFVIAMSEASTRLYVPGLLRRMLEAAPLASLTCLGVSGASVRLFNEGGVDLLVVPGGAWLNEDDRSWMDRQPSEPVADEPRVCLAWSGNRAIGESVTLEQIRRAGVLIPSFISNDGRPPAERPLGRYYGADIRVVAEIPAGAIGPSLVGTGMVALLGQRLARLEASRYDLKLARLPIELDRHTSLNMYWHKRSIRDPAVAWLKSILREEITAYTTPDGTEVGADALASHHPGVSGAAGSR